MRNCLIALFLLIATTASAQVKNPTQVLFKVSDDHSTVTSYEMDIKRVSDNAVIQTINLGKPAPDAQGNASAAINVQPVVFGTYYVVLRAVAGTLKSDDSTPSNQWQRVPGKPSGAQVQ